MLSIDANRHVVAIKTAECATTTGLFHLSAVKLADNTEIARDDLVALVEAGRKYFVEAPGHMKLVTEDGSVHSAAGMPILVQVRICADCGQKVPFA